jgi:hypothetical protein
MATFEARKEDVIEEVLKAGGSVSISARYQVVPNLIRFAQLAHNTGGTLWLWDTDPFTTEELVAIAKAGKKNVVMDIRQSASELPRHTKT